MKCQVNNNQLFINENKILLEASICKAEIVNDNNCIVLVESISWNTDEPWRNILSFDEKGNFIWKIESVYFGYGYEINSGHPDPFTDFEIKNNLLFAENIRSIYEIDPQDGTVISCTGLTKWKSKSHS